MNRLIKSLRRSTNSTDFIPEIDGLRFYAIITVVVFHLNTAFSRQIGLDDLGLSLLGGRENLWSPAWWLIRLDLGVKVFFAISGMVLALPFLRQYLTNSPTIPLSDYFYRRLTRLEPPFIASLIFFTCVHALLLHESLQDLIPHFGVGLLYSHVLIYGQPNPINPVTWSLETEAQFYLLVPLFFGLLLSFRSSIWFASVILLSFSVSIILRNYFIIYEINQLSSSVLAYFSNFIVGILVAWIYLRHKIFILKKNHTWDIIWIISFFGQFYFYKPQHLYLNNLLFNFFTFITILATFKGHSFNWFFTRPIVYLIGGMCYSIYLLHFAFFHLIVQLTASVRTSVSYGLDLFLQLIICLPAVLIISGIFYLLVEKPCMNRHWPQQLTLWVRNRLQ